MDEELWADSRQYLESLAAQSTSGTSISVTHEVLCGEPTEMICRRIDEVNADLVGMTSHGLTGLAQAWFGRVAEGVLGHCTVPVLLIRPLEPSARGEAVATLFKKVLIPDDGSAASLEVFDAAASLVKCCDATITLVRVIQPVPVVSAGAKMPSSRAPVADAPVVDRLVDEAKGEDGMSSSKAFRRSPNPGAFTATHASLPRILLTTSVASGPAATSSATTSSGRPALATVPSAAADPASSRCVFRE